MFLFYFHKKNISTNKYTNAFAPLSVWDCTIPRIAPPCRCPVPFAPKTGELPRRETFP